MTINTPTLSACPDMISKWLSGRDMSDLVRQFECEGYLVFEKVLDNDQVQRTREALEPLLEQDVTGRNDFEGAKSNRIYAMLNKSPVFAELITHPLLLGWAEAEMGKSCLLSACLAIQLKPGESVQPWHTDDAHLQIPRPRAAYGLSAFWAIDETTAENGATEIIPGSHKWSGESIVGSLNDADLMGIDPDHGAADAGAHADAIKVLLHPGDLMIAKGTLWHRGGANNSDKSRLIVTPQFCPGWARQLENMLLAVTPDNAAKLPQRVQQLLGYSIHPPFMGYVDGMHPSRVLKA